MNLYVMRHGTTVWNEKGITQGRTNNRLSKQGIFLTQNVAKQLKDIDFDVIISSPLMRAIQTANIINQYHKVKIFKDINLIEINQGIFTGKSKYSLTDEEKVMKAARSKDAGMESYQSCFDRIKNFLDKLKKNDKFENVLVITHNCNASFIEDIITNKKINFNDDNFLRNFKNAEVKIFVI